MLFIFILISIYFRNELMLSSIEELIKPTAVNIVLLNISCYQITFIFFILILLSFANLLLMFASRYIITLIETKWYKIIVVFTTTIIITTFRSIRLNFNAPV